MYFSRYGRLKGSGRSAPGRHRLACRARHEWCGASSESRGRLQGSRGVTTLWTLAERCVASPTEGLETHLWILAARVVSGAARFQSAVEGSKARGLSPGSGRLPRGAVR